MAFLEKIWFYACTCTQTYSCLNMIISKNESYKKGEKHGYIYCDHVTAELLFIL